MPSCLHLFALSAVVLLVAVSQAAGPDPEFDEQGPVDAVFHDRDVLDLILDRVPLRQLPMFDRLSVDHVRLRRLLDPWLPAKYLPLAIKSVARWTHLHADLRGRQDWAAALSLTGRLLALRKRRNIDVVELARYLVSELGLNKVGVLLPVEALRLEFEPAKIAQFLELNAEGHCGVTLPDYVTECVEDAVDSAMMRNFDQRFSRTRHPSPTDFDMAEWRKNAELLADPAQRAEMLRTLRYYIQRHSALFTDEAASSDKRLQQRMLWYGVHHWSTAQPAPHAVLLEICRRIPSPFCYVYAHPAAVTAHLLQNLPDYALTNTETLLGLRRVGIAFSCDLYLQRMQSLDVDLRQVVPFLDNSGATDLVRDLLDTKQDELLDKLCDIADFVAFFDPVDGKWMRYLEGAVVEPTEALLQFLTRFPAMGEACVLPIHANICERGLRPCAHDPDAILLETSRMKSVEESVLNISSWESFFGPRRSGLSPYLDNILIVGSNKDP